MELQDKIYFMPGDLVTLKQDVPNKPVMVVLKKESNYIKKEDSSHFKGIRCFWFSKLQERQEEVFNTKDLVLFKP